MSHLQRVTLDELHAALERVEGKTPTKRLLAAIAYKNGVSQTELAEWFDVERKTIYNWLTRFDRADVEAAATDDPRPGRPRKLSAGQLEELRRTVRNPPTEAGYDERYWTPVLVRERLLDVYGVEYSIPSCRRLLLEAGVRYERPHWRSKE